MQIQSKLKSYDIVLEEDFSFAEKLAQIENSFFVVDQNVFELYPKELASIKKENCYILEATEQNKVIDTALDICERITDIPAKRNATLISIGGGIIQDITGFVANIMYRGIHWIFVPTTLLAACDSCIGGKTSLNYKRFKNLLGTFFPPDEIHICSRFFYTLSEKDFKSGLGEVVKFNIMAGVEGLERIETQMESLLKREPETVNAFTESSLSFKKSFIEIDEFDRGERIKLNFAHTFGHAIEVVSSYEIPHGTAVAIGMIMANAISKKRGILPEEIVNRSEQVLLQVIDIEKSLLEAPIESYIQAMRKDKKQTSDALTAVLLQGYQPVAQLEVVHDITEEDVVYAKEYFLDLYKGTKK